MTTIPPNLLPPKRRAALTIRALQHPGTSTRCPRPTPTKHPRPKTQSHAHTHTHPRSRRRRRRSTWVQLLRDVGYGPLKGHAAHTRVYSDDIALCADDMDDEGVGIAFVTTDVASQLAQPAGHLLEAVFVGDVIAEEAGVGAAVVETRDGAEALLAGSVPDLEADGGVGGCIEDTFGHKGRADGGSGGGGVEGVPDVTLDERGFADA